MQGCIHSCIRFFVHIFSSMILEKYVISDDNSIVSCIGSTERIAVFHGRMSGSVESILGYSVAQRLGTPFQHFVKFSCPGW